MHHRHPEANAKGLNLNLAREWAKVGVRASGPGVGEIVVWPHHVGEITGFDQHRHQWIVLSGNSGPHRTVTEHPRSVDAAIAFRRI